MRFSHMGITVQKMKELVKFQTKTFIITESSSINVMPLGHLLITKLVHRIVKKYQKR
jgi:hypothetical protein